MTYQLPEPVYTAAVPFYDGRDQLYNNAQMQAAYAAGLAARVPEGWRLVPIDRINRAVEALLAAAPEPTK